MDKHLINEIVDKVVREKVCEILMLEYAIDRKAFINRVWNLSPMLISHWCLIRYNRLTDREEYIDHWKNEVFGWMEYISVMKLKRNNDVESRQKALLQAWDDLDYISNPEAIKAAIYRKFGNEEIDMRTPLIDEVANAFIADSHTIIALISKGDVGEMREYINSL